MHLADHVLRSLKVVIVGRIVLGTTMREAIILHDHLRWSQHGRLLRVGVFLAGGLVEGTSRLLHGALNRRHAELMLQGTIWKVARILRVRPFLAQREVTVIVAKSH